MNERSAYKSHEQCLQRYKEYNKIYLRNKAKIKEYKKQYNLRKKT